MPRFIDLSHPLFDGLPNVPNAPQLSVKVHTTVGQAGNNLSHLSLSRHQGTHLGATGMPIAPSPRRGSATSGTDTCRVALLVEASTGSAREHLRGIADFLRSQGVRWTIAHLSRRLHSGPPSWLSRWRGDGIIARVHSPKTAAVIARLGVPAVDLWGQPWAASLPRVVPDENAIGVLAAEHLFERGFRRFAFLGVENVAWSNARAEAFARAVAARGCPCERFDLRGPPLTGLPPTSRLPALRGWLLQQSHPVGIMGANDFYAATAAAACAAAGLAIPEQAAVVGVDNDEPVCEFASPPLTSVVVNHRRAGFEAASLLDRLMAKAASGALPVVVPPVGIVTRQSTAGIATSDPLVALALKLIRSAAYGPLSIDDIASRLKVSRAGLTRAFAAVVGHGIHDEILRVRLQEAQRLLTETNLKLDAIARKSGFEHPEHLGRVFRRKLGITPGQYRHSLTSRGK